MRRTRQKHCILRVYSPAQVFGKVLVCKDLDVAGRAAHTSNLNCVTIKGDQVSKKGTITGGFRDIKR